MFFSGCIDDILESVIFELVLPTDIDEDDADTVSVEKVISVGNAVIIEADSEIVVEEPRFL